MSSEKDGWQIETVRIKELDLYIESCEDTSRLDLEKRISLSLELTPLTGKGFLRYDLHSNELTEDVANHVVMAPRLIVVRNKDNEAVAFIASEIKNIEGLIFYHLGGIILDPSLQGSGLGLTLLRTELRKTQADGIVLRTQSKKMLGLTEKVATLDPELTLTLAKIAYPENLDHSVNKGVYRGGHSLYENEELFAKDAIDTIDWRSGDSLVIAGWIKKDL